MSQEDVEVIRMTQWAEVRHLHLVEDVPKKEIARRLKLDVKTERRAMGRSTPPPRVSPRRPSSLDPWRERITQWLGEEPKVTAKRIRRLLRPSCTVAWGPGPPWRSTSASRGSTSPACRAR